MLFGSTPRPDCLSTGSRARAACEPTTTGIATETEVKFTVELPPLKTAQCAATIEIEYTQRDTLVGVEGTIITWTARHPMASRAHGHVRDETAS